MEPLISSSIWAKSTDAFSRPASRSTTARRAGGGARRHAHQRIAHAIDGKPHGMRKFGVEQQEFGDLLRPDRRRVGFAIGLERRAEFQQHQPVEIFGRVRDIRFRRAEMQIEQAADQLCALDMTAELQKIPAFAMAEGRIGDAAQRMQICQAPRGTGARGDAPRCRPWSRAAAADKADSDFPRPPSTIARAPGAHCRAHCATRSAAKTDCAGRRRALA